MRHSLKSLGPAAPRVPVIEACRAGIGALLALGLTGLLVFSPAMDLETGLYLVAPFGATSVLLFAVPNSPLAQPWSVVVGNTVAALVAVAVCMVIDDALLRIGLSVGLAITATMLCRALHPPAGAVAMTAALAPEAIDHLGFWFALAPIGTGSAALVAFAALYARLTGRRYPFRQFDDPSRHRTRDRDPAERLGLSQEALGDILARYSQSFNVGVEDLARLIGAAEREAVAQSSGPLTAGDVMSRDLITVGLRTGLAEVASLFKRHGFTSLPVVGDDAKFLGVIFQMHLIAQATDDALRLKRGYLPALRRLLDRGRSSGTSAGDIMNVAGPRAMTTTPIGALLHMMADGRTDAVPVLEYGAIIGIVTRTDLIAALARNAVRP